MPEAIGNRLAVDRKEKTDDRLVMNGVAHDERDLPGERRPAYYGFSGRGEPRCNPDRLVHRSGRPLCQRVPELCDLLERRRTIGFDRGAPMPMIVG